MAKKETTSQAAPMLPMLKTVEQMSKVSGIGENKLRELMDSGELEYIQNGNRRLIADSAIWDWYHRAKTAAKSDGCALVCLGSLYTYVDISKLNEEI